MVNVCIVNFKTPELTEAAVLSVRKHTKDASVTVYDSSCDYNGTADRIIKNEIDFDKFILDYPDRASFTTNGYGSAKHCYTIDYCFRFFDDGFILLDSDVLVKKDLSELYQTDKIWVGQPHVNKKHEVNIPRLYPFCCFINTKLCSENGIRYFDGNHMWELTSGIGRWYDTGAWFLEATKNYPHKEIEVTDYILHFGRGSYSNSGKWKKWLEINKSLYE